MRMNLAVMDWVSLLKWCLCPYFKTVLFRATISIWRFTLFALHLNQQMTSQSMYICDVTMKAKTLGLTILYTDRAISAIGKH